MEIDKEKCVGCGNCHAVCTMGVIYLDEDGKSAVNQDECVECNTCYRTLRNERHVYNWILGPVGKDDWRGKLRKRVDRFRSDVKHKLK